MANFPSLPELQSWFLTVMTAPGGADAGLALARSRFAAGIQAEALLRPARGRHSGLHIYADGYVLRLLECLRADFPVLRKVMGGELFDFFAKGYIWRFPSRAPSLYELGAGFGDFLRLSQSADAQLPQAPLMLLPVDLARLERACAEAGRAPGLEGGAAPAADSFGLLLGHETALRLTPCTRLLALSFPLKAFWEQASMLADEQAPPPVPQPQPCFLAVTRMHYRVTLHDLQPWQYHYLQAAQGGAPALHCIHQAAEQAQLPVERILAEALLWQPVACAAGMLEVIQGMACGATGHAALLRE
jgi:hypothetical protein